MEMARKLRYVPPDGGLFEITTRTVQGRFLMSPSEDAYSDEFDQ